MEEIEPSSRASRDPERSGTACPACGTAILPDQRFCGQCGAPMARPCAACGTQNPAVNRFCGQCGASLQPAAGTTAPPEPERAPALPREERRWATVLFADLSGFTAMAERMDPEDVKVLVHRCAEHLGDLVSRFGGTVINVMGDGVLAAFGAPLAHEDDAERAVRAALAMRDSSLSDDPVRPIRLHIGINTGEVMAGLVGPLERRDYTVTGDTVNTADRLASAAPPGCVLVGEETYRATRQVVGYRELPPVAVKGKEQPVAVWEALAAVTVPVARPLGTAPLVGRAAELALLAGIWTKAVREAQPQLVTLLGEPGIGKSRLVAEFEQQHLGGVQVIHGRCLPYGEALGYWALAAALKEAAGISAEDDAETARLSLSRMVASALGPDCPEEAREVARHLALLSGLDLAADRSAAGADQRVLHASVRRFLEALARQAPLCLMLEDIHWADEALLVLIESVAARGQDAPLLIVTQARPELLEKRPTWGRGVRSFTSLSLEPLDERARQELIRALCRRHGLSESTAEAVGRGSGGNPLFAEELVATFAERGGTAGIPSMIKALISARLDALPPTERRALQLAAVFGKLFWEGGVRALDTTAPLAGHLAALEQKALLRVQPRSQFRGEREYAFKHDLIQDVAYEMLPRAERRVLHGQAGEWIEQAVGEQADEYFDLLAHHAVQADQPERALDYLVRAAERAHRTAAHRHEAALLAQALALAERLDQRSVVADLHARRGTAFSRLAMWPEARRELEAALATLGTPRPERRAEVLVDLSTVCFWAMDIAGLRRATTEALTLAEQVGREDLAAAAMAWLAEAEKSAGDLFSARDYSLRAIARAGGLRVAPLANAPLTFYLLGQMDQAVEIGREALQASSGTNDTLFTMYALTHMGLVLAGSGRYDEALRFFDKAREFGREYELGHFVSRATAMSAGLHLDVYDFTGHEAVAYEARELALTADFRPSAISAGIDLLLNFARRQEVGRAEKLIEEVAVAVEQTQGWHGWLWKLRLAQARAEIALARSEWEEAHRWATDALEQSRVKGRVKYQVLGLGSRGMALAALARTKEAIADLRSAVELARPVGDPTMFLRAATALLALDGSDALLAEARATAQRIAAALPEDLRCRFEAAEPVRLLARLT